MLVKSIGLLFRPKNLLKKILSFKQNNIIVCYLNPHITRNNYDVLYGKPYGNVFINYLVHMSYPESISFHFFMMRDLAVMSTPITDLHSFPLSCSVRFMSSRCRRFHRSNSDKGPALGSWNLSQIDYIIFNLIVKIWK